MPGKDWRGSGWEGKVEVCRQVQKGEYGEVQSWRWGRETEGCYVRAGEMMQKGEIAVI